MIKLKICGITSLEDARAAIDCGAEYLGFNFYPRSPRYIAPETARRIIDRLPGEIINVGIFVNEPHPKNVIEIMTESGVVIAQLHGDEDADYCRRVGAQHVIKALRVHEDFDLRSIFKYPSAAILLDAFDKNLYGGTGKTANWEIARQAAAKTRVFLAGGLSPENIAGAIHAVQPFAVDINSGVESAPGRKDLDKLRRLKQKIENL